MYKIAAIAAAAIAAVSQPAGSASPSFDCKTNHSLLERLVCSDEELARLDVEMSKAYAAAMKRAGHAGNAALLADQRDFNKDLLQGVEYRLNEASPDAEPAEEDLPNGGVWPQGGNRGFGMAHPGRCPASGPGRTGPVHRRRRN